MADVGGGPSQGTSINSSPADTGLGCLGLVLAIAGEAFDIDRARREYLDQRKHRRVSHQECDEEAENEQPHARCGEGHSTWADRARCRGSAMIGTTKSPVWAMKKLVRIAALGAMLALSGCVTAENALTQNDIASMNLTGVNVSFAPDALVMWEDGERAYASAKAVSDEQMAAARRTQDYKDFVHNMLGARIKAGVEQAMAGQLIGSRPVRLEIVVRLFKVPSVASRVLIGSDPEMTASATLVDARTGATIIVHPKLAAFVLGGRGLVGTAVQAAIDSSRNQTQEGQLIARYGEMYREWLTHGA